MNLLRISSINLSSCLVTLVFVIYSFIPVSAVAQTEDGIDTETTSATSDGSTYDDQENLEDVSDVIEVSEEVQAQLPAGSTIPTDTYRREQLPSAAVVGDFVIGPGRFSIELAPGESRTVEMMVSNRMGDGRIFSFATEDMTGSDDTDQTIVLLGEQVGPYTLRDFISVPHNRFYLEHGYRARVPITITLPPDAEPGGRYGSLLTSIVTNPTELGQVEGARPGSAIISRIATLFFITTPGEIDRNSELIDFSTKNRQRFFTQGPVDFNLVTENYGTVHTTPYGRITVRNILGEQIWVGNIEPWFVMPDSIRTRIITWESDFLFGRYTATAEINRGYNDIVDELTFSFYVIPWKLVAAVFVGLFILFLLVRLFFSRFELKRK